MPRTLCGLLPLLLGTSIFVGCHEGTVAKVPLTRDELSHSEVLSVTSTGAHASTVEFHGLSSSNPDNQGDLVGERSHSAVQGNVQTVAIDLLRKSARGSRSLHWEKLNCTSGSYSVWGEELVNGVVVGVRLEWESTETEVLAVAQVGSDGLARIAPSRLVELGQCPSVLVKAINSAIRNGSD
jgi:hypothetical protein